MGSFFVVVLAAFAAVGSFLFGYDQGVMTNVIASPHFLNYFDTSPESDIVGAMNSTFSGGAAVGALCGGYITEVLGRKWTIVGGATVATVGAILQAAAQSLPMMLVGRIISGWAIGLLSMVIPMYQAECAPPAKRGLIVGTAQFMIGLGTITAAWVGYGCNRTSDTSAFQWRFPLAFQCIPSAVLMVGMPFFPESPRHLIRMGKFDQGMAVLRKLHTSGESTDWVENEFHEIKTAIDKENEVTIPTLKAICVIPQWRKRFIIAFLMQFFGQCTGINVFNYYQTIMYRNLGIHGDNITLLSCFYNMAGTLSILVFINFAIDRVGRRMPLLIGCVAISLFLLLEAIVTSQNTDGNHKGLSGLGILWMWLHCCFFSASFGPICWAYMSELLPTQIRATGSAICVGIGLWAVNVMWSQVSPKALGKIGWKYYFVFLAINVCVTFPVMWKWFVETKGVPLEEIDNLFGGPVDLSRWSNAAPAAAEKAALEHTEELAKGDVTVEAAAADVTKED
ncbi:General substrate transporter [Ascosphaera apis ARSEF 7405]|uniref:General substrate transporter n=1 Tax=Ascosphaera apis ARSEF 7405 TaxID=392613 RepID=A0A166NM70_9EURO|nr:General substrate transporter [Ascosphaera apis ARSEF 7405]